MSFVKPKNIVLLLLAVIMILSTVSCQVDLSSTEEESRAYMIVDGYDVPYELYRYMHSMHLRDRLLAEGVEEEKAEALDDSDLSVKRQAEISSLVNEESERSIVGIYAVFGAAERKGIDPFGERINQLTDMKMEELRAGYGSDKAYLRDLQKNYMTDNVCSIITRNEIVSEQLYDEYVKTGDIKVTDEDIIEYMMSDDAIRLKQILISFERHSEEEAKQLADEVYGCVMAYVSADGIVDEAQFDILTDKYGEDLFTFKNRDGYYVYKGYVDEAFEAAGFGLEVGHVSEPVRVNAGYSIVLRAEKDETFIKENVSTLKDGCLAGVYNTIIDELIETIEIAYIK